MRTLITAALLVVATSTARAESVDDIIAKHLKARGGAEKVAGVPTLRMTGKLQAGPGIEAQFTIEVKKPGRMRFEVTVQGMTIVQTVDGDSGWTIQPMTGKKDA